MLTLQDAMLRRSEAAALDLADLDLGDAGGGTVTVRRSKTDIAGEGVTLYLGPQTVFWLRRWIERAGITAGAVFRAVNKAGRPGRRLRAPDVNRRLKALAQAAGLDPAVVSGHSGRRGTCGDLVVAGASLGEIMDRGRWRSPDMIMIYCAGQLARRGAVARLLHGQAGS